MAASSSTRSGGVDVLTGREILIVDDSRTTLELLGRRLEKLGCEVAQAIDGVDALSLLDGREFDLVLIDMVMPRLSGVRTLREMRSSLRHTDTPAIMMTARSDPAAAIEALEAGADDHIAKPIDFPVLAARIKRLLRRAAMIGNLRKMNAALDSRIATRAHEASELRAQLAAVHVDRSRLAETVAHLQSRLASLDA